MGGQDVFSLKKGDIIDFHDLFLVKGLPIPNFNILAEGPFHVTETYKHGWSHEVTIEGAKSKAFLECEKDDDEVIIQIQIRIDRKFPELCHKLMQVWDSDSTTFEFNSVNYYLRERDWDESDEEEYEYWDYYSPEISEDQMLFIGVEDYGDPGKPEYEVLVGFTIPERAIKEIISS